MATCADNWVHDYLVAPVNDKEGEIDGKEEKEEIIALML